MADVAPATYPARCKMAASSTAARFPDNYCLCTRQFPVGACETSSPNFPVSPFIWACSTLSQWYEAKPHPLG